MAVIAKMYALNTPRRFATAQQVDLTCVCDDRLMANSAACKDGGLENRTFNTASPSGDCRFHTGLDALIRQREEFYLIFARGDECPSYDGALVVSKLRCGSVTDFGGTSRQVEVYSDYGPANTNPRYHPNQSDTFNLRMMIDNPDAAVQFEPGKAGYWVGIYRACDFTMHDALSAAFAPAAVE